jgi:hypothetical protein
MSAVAAGVLVAGRCASDDYEDGGLFWRSLATPRKSYQFLKTFTLGAGTTE